METKSLELPTELLQVVSQLTAGDLAKETAKLLALELFREDKFSLGRAAELCHTPIEAFMEFAAEHEVPLHYGIATVDYREQSKRLTPIGLKQGTFKTPQVWQLPLPSSD